MARRRKRDLSAEEQRLWEHVARHVTPLPGRGGDRARDPADAPSATGPGRASEPAGEASDSLMHSTASFSGHTAAPEAAGPAGRTSRKNKASNAGRGAPERPAPVLPPYIPPVSRKSESLPTGTGSGGLDRRERRSLRRRVREVDDRLDLHGMRQEEAHRALIRFLQSASARDCAIVLVVTGKGGVGGPGYGDERGVLRRITPHWLRASELRPFVVGFEEAAAHHGGAGALYVRLRRRGR
ncbi:MAG: Smr/MutS family protein [Salinarimonas sp.]|nr:Smr/MutS family protein [Salinarimonas sp.]